MKRSLPLFVAVANLVLTTAAWACPFCKDSIPSSDAQSSASVPGGFNNSVYLMLLSFFAMLGFVTFTLVKGARGVQPPRGGRGFPLE
jgi:hypothetical protein